MTSHEQNSKLAQPKQPSFTRRALHGRQTPLGFTIVELLVVIVVIVILASIVLVAYVGVQNQTRAEHARTNAASVKKAAEGYYNTRNVYPTQVAHFSSSFVTMPSDITLLTSGSLSATNGEKSIMYRYVGGGTGACIIYWEFAPTSGSPVATVLARLGTATTGNCTATTGSLPS